jgi:hypothetical protein
MGFFKSMRELNKQSKEISRNWDVGAQLGQAQASMAQANAVLEQQTLAANVALNGVDASGTITGFRQSPTMINHQPVVEIDLLILAPGAPPRPVTVQQAVPHVHIPMLQHGRTVKLKVDPANPDAVWINFAAG